MRTGHRTQKLSARGHIRSVAVATNARGDVLAAWDRALAEVAELAEATAPSGRG